MCGQVDPCGTRGRLWQPWVCCSISLQEGACGEECSQPTAASYSIFKIHSSIQAGYVFPGSSQPVRGDSRATRARSSLPSSSLWASRALAETFHRAASQSRLFLLTLLFSSMSDLKAFPDYCFFASLSFTGVTPKPSLVLSTILGLNLETQRTQTDTQL